MLKMKNNKSILPAVCGAAAIAFAGATEAAVVPIEQTLTLENPSGSLVYNIATDGGAAATTSFYQLIVDPTWTFPTKFTTFSTEPTGTTASYSLYVDIDPSTATSDTGAPLTSWTVTDVPMNNTIPFYTYLLGAGQYVLQLTTLPTQFSISTQISAVPLPGAIWLFGSALLAFLGISARRKL